MDELELEIQKLQAMSGYAYTELRDLEVNMPELITTLVKIIRKQQMEIEKLKQK